MGQQVVAKRTQGRWQGGGAARHGKRSAHWKVSTGGGGGGLIMAATSERIIRLWNEGVTARVKVAGQGPPLAYLHNGYGLVWDECLDLLARDFTVYAPEHPGTSAGDPDSIK